jgi:serine phosphatase RsbU (regulator of sigma subunit)
VTARDLQAELRAQLARAIGALDDLLASRLPIGVEARVRAARDGQLELLRSIGGASAPRRAHAAGATTPLTVPPAGPGAATILLVGDDAARDDVAAVLAPVFLLAHAADPDAALGALRRSGADLVLAGTAGAELCRALRSDPELAGVPVVLLTHGTAREALERGAADVVVEPFHPEELVSRLRNLIALHHKERMLVRTLDELRESRRIFDEDLQQARSLQLARLPRAPVRRDLRIEVVYRPAEVVGGDLCDVHVAGGRHRFFLADTTGHGLRASLQTMVVKTIWDRHKAAAAGPGEALERLNDEIFTLDPGLQTRLSACCFDLELGPDGARLTYATAAHPPILLASGGVPTELWLPNTFVGLLRGVRFAQAELALRPGDRVIAYSDGLVERWTTTGERVADEDVFRVLAQPGTLADAILLTFRLLDRLAGGTPPADDVTLLAVEIPR